MGGPGEEICETSARTSKMGNPLARASYYYRRRRATGVRAVLLRGLPRPARRGLKFLIQVSLDGFDWLRGRRGEMVPPHRLNFAGDGDFEATGDEFLGYFLELGCLKPEHRVLEIGCGIGRMARPLTKYLTTGSYEGIDIVPRGVKWCTEEISARHPRFVFRLADIRNDLFNPKGRTHPSEYVFPFGEGEFDFVFLTSVFTHMLRAELVQYLREITRTLKPGGRCLATFFLLNPESRSLIHSGSSSLNFRFVRSGCWTNDEGLPESAVAYEESDILAECQKVRLGVETIRYGSWCGRANYLSYQDILVAKKA